MVHKLPPGAEMTPEKIEQIQTRNALLRIKSLRLDNLLAPFHHRYYRVLCRSENVFGERDGECPALYTWSPTNVEADSVVVRGHPLYALLYRSQCIDPAFFEVECEPAKPRASAPLQGELAHVLYSAKQTMAIRRVDASQPEWNLSLLELLAEFHPFEDVRRLAITVLGMQHANQILAGIAKRAKRGSYALWLAETLMFHKDPWRNWILRHCHLKLNTL